MATTLELGVSCVIDILEPSARNKICQQIPTLQQIHIEDVFQELHFGKAPTWIEGRLKKVFGKQDVEVTWSDTSNDEDPEELDFHLED